MSETRGRGGRFGVPALTLAVIFVAAIILRILWLDRLTGIDGDEAWYGVLGQHWAAGEFILWRTPTGNYPGPIQPALVGLGQFLLPAHFILLRIPSLLSSLLAMALAWRIGRKHFDLPTARIGLLLMAVLPANIAYARFGWDPSHSGMLALAAIACVLEGRLVLTALLFGLAVWTHPTNVFIAPLLLPVAAAVERNRWRLCALAVALILIAAAMMMVGASQSGQFADPRAMLARLLSPADWFAFVLLYARLLAGQPWFLHLAESSYGPLLPLVDAAGLLAIGGTLFATARTLQREGLSTRGGLLLGWIAMLAAYALVAGIAALNAPTERYAFVLIAPTALAFAVAIGGSMRKFEPLGIAVAGGTLLAASVALYFVPLATRDLTGRSDWLGVQAFRTGPIEPKEAAARWIAAQARPDRPIRVIAEDWWLAWPLAYRLAGETSVTVDWAGRPDGGPQSRPATTLVATYAGSPDDDRLAETGARPLFVSEGYDGRPVVRLWARAMP